MPGRQHKHQTLENSRKSISIGSMQALVVYDVTKKVVMKEYRTKILHGIQEIEQRHKQTLEERGSWRNQGGYIRRKVHLG